MGEIAGVGQTCEDIFSRQAWIIGKNGGLGLACGEEFEDELDGFTSQDRRGKDDAVRHHVNDGLAGTAESARFSEGELAFGLIRKGLCFSWTIANQTQLRKPRFPRSRDWSRGADLEIRRAWRVANLHYMASAFSFFLDCFVWVGVSRLKDFGLRV